MNKKVEVNTDSEIAMKKVFEKLREPDFVTYEINIEKSTIGGKFPKASREEKTKFDRRPAIDPNIDAVKKIAP